MSSLKIPQSQKSPSSKSENGRHQFHPYEIQIQQAPSSSLPPHIPDEQGFETSIANALNELSGLMSASSSMNQVAQPMQQSPQNRSNPSSQQQQLNEMHQNMTAMHNRQGGDLGSTSQMTYYKIPERPFLSYMGSGPGPEGNLQSFHQHAAESWMSSSFYPMNGREGGRLQQPRVEAAAASNQNSQMLNENALQQTIPADNQKSSIPMDQNVTTMSGSQEHGQEAYSQDGQAPLSPVLPHVGPEAGFYAQSYPKQATESSGSWMPSQHAEHSCGGHGGLPLLYSISNAGTDKFGRTKIVMQLPRPPIGQYQSIILNHDSIALSGWQDYSPGVEDLNGQEPLGPVPSQVGPQPADNPQSHPQQATGPSGKSMPSQHAKHSLSCSMPDSEDEELQTPFEIFSADTAESTVVKLPILAAAEPLSIPVHQNAMPNVEIQCPLDPSTTFTSKRWTLEEIKEIEAHVRTSSSCPHGPHPSLQDLIVTGLEEHERSTPLLMACLHGDLKAVKRIVQRWKVNVYKGNVIPMSGTLVHSVSPLFVAASKSFTNIVRYLMENGFLVSSRTNAAEMEYCGLMPLHAAVRFGGDNGDGNPSMQISTIRLLLENGADPSALPHDGVPMWLNVDTPDGQIITLLAQFGLNLSQRSPSPRGLTPLHIWAGEYNVQHEDMSLDVVKMLLERGSDIQARDYDGFSVILTAAQGNDNMPNFPVLNYLLERDDISRTDKIDALELAGAVILGNEENHERFPLALHYWSRALALRAEGRPLYKTPIKSKNKQLSEWSTTEDLLQIEQDPSQREVQSLLVRLRIFSSISWRAVHLDYLPYFMEYLNKEVDENHTLSQMLDFSCVTLEKIVRFYPIERELQSEASNIMNELVSTIFDLPKDDSFFNSFNSPAFKTFFELVLMTDLYFTDGKKDAIVDDSHIQNLTFFFTILARRPEMITEDMNQSLKQILRRDSRTPDGDNVLLVVCGLSVPEEAVSTVRFLLQLGADPNVTYVDGVSPLHRLAEELGKVEIRDATARLLLESGAHLDMVNNERKTPADVWLDLSREEGLNVVWEDLPNWLKGDCKNLTCLSARVIRDHQVPYHGSKLPAELIPFVKMH